MKNAKSPKSKGNGKIVKRLRRLQKGKKLKKHVIERFRSIQATKRGSQIARDKNIEEDWIKDREFVDLNDDDILPLDMVDADIDWENSAFASKIKKLQDGNGENEEIESFESSSRRFAGQLKDDMKELLPIKLNGKIVRQTQKVDDDDDENSADDVDDNDAECVSHSEEDLSHLSAADLIKKRAEYLEEAKTRISNIAHIILSDPVEKISALKDLYQICTGVNESRLIRETVMKFATVSLTEILIDIIPGYVIRKKSADEAGQNLKKETRKINTYEQKLLRIYISFLQRLEKFGTKLLSPRSKEFSSTFAGKMSILSIKCFSRLVIAAPHFNNSSSIIDILVRCSTSGDDEASEICCNTLCTLFRNDYTFAVSATGVKSIAKIVNQKKGVVTPQLLFTLLKLNIKEVNKNVRNNDRGKLLNKQMKLRKERKMKSKAKYANQLKKLEAELKETEAAESVSKKMAFATETMNFVFTIYFRVIKRMSNTNLLAPVLEGLSKFAHLINIEFFDNLISAIGALIDQQHLRIIDSIRCIHTVFVILSGEGVVLNIDPSKYYRSIYRIFPNLIFLDQNESMHQTMLILLHTCKMMINGRRKQVPVSRVAAFIKRLLSITFFLPTAEATAILLLIRSFLLAHQRLMCLVHESDEMCVTESYKAQMDDPDCSGALSSNIIVELQILLRHPNKFVVSVVQHIAAGCPSQGAGRLSAQTCSVNPSEWYERNVTRNSQEVPFFSNEITAFAKARKMQLTSKNFPQIICMWLEENSKNK